MPPENKPHIMEGKTLRAIWKNGRFDRWNLCTQTGHALHVHFPGRFRVHPAPHFAGAILELDGTLLAGSVAVFGDDEAAAARTWMHRPPVARLALLVTFRNLLPVRSPYGEVPALEMNGKTWPQSNFREEESAVVAENFQMPAYICN